jgi:hypothetical protein
MRLLFLVLCGLPLTGLRAEPAPEIPTDVTLVASGECFPSEELNELIFCELYTERVGGTQYYWKRVWLKATNTVIHVSWWEDGKPELALVPYQIDDFFFATGASL